MIFTAIERMFLISVIRRTIAGSGGNMATYDPMIQKAAASNSPVDWQALLQQLLTDLPQILAAVAAIISLFGGAAASHVKGAVVKTATGYDVVWTWTAPAPGTNPVNSFACSVARNSDAPVSFTLPGTATSADLLANVSVPVNPGDTFTLTIITVDSLGNKSMPAVSNIVTIPNIVVNPVTGLIGAAVPPN